MEYKCTECTKDYSSYQSLWIHNKKYHKLSESYITHNISNTLKYMIII